MLKQINHNKLLEIIDTYVLNSDFYQNKYKNIKISNIQNVPFLTKNELIEDQKKYPPFGSNLSSKLDKIVRIHKTSGTTNKPYLIALTKSDLKIITKIGSKLFKLTGMKEQDIVINCLNYNMWMGGYTDHQSLEKAGVIVVPFGTGNTDNLISLMQELNGSSIHCTPSYLGVIKEKLLKLKITPKELKLKNGYFAAEGGLENKKFRKKIEKEWGISAYNANYGLSEVVSILGAECQNKNGLHFGALDVLYLELIDKNLNSIKIKKGAIGELVVTHLKKEAQPLIRYKTGDIFEVLSLKVCNCGFKGLTFKLSGRIDNMIVIKGINFFPESIRSIITNYSNCSGIYKVIVSKKEPVEMIKVLIELNSFNLNIEEFRQKLFKDIKEKLNVSVIIEFVNKIEFVGNKMKILERV